MRCDRSGVPLGVPSGVTRVTAGLAWVLLPRRVRLGYYLNVSYGIFRKLQSLLLLILETKQQLQQKKRNDGLQ